jgi:hypothetical protein
MSDILCKIACTVGNGSFIKLRNGEFSFIKVFGMINIHDAPVIVYVPIIRWTYW